MHFISEVFRKFAKHTAHAVGSSAAFVLAFGTIVVWAVSGPYYGYSSDWQLVINTGTTIVTFLTVFLIQNTQNREALQTQLKLDELIKSLKHARNSMMDLDNLSDDELHALEKSYREARKERIEDRK